MDKNIIICDKITYRNGKVSVYDADMFTERSDKEAARKLNADRMAFAFLYEEGILSSVSDFITENIDVDGEYKGVYFVLNISKLEPYMDMIKEKFPETRLPNISQMDPAPSPCVYSGCISITTPMRTYRDNCGCVGRSWETVFVQCLNNEDDILKTYQAEGAVKAGIASIQSYLEPEPIQEEAV